MANAKNPPPLKGEYVSLLVHEAAFERLVETNQRLNDLGDVANRRPLTGARMGEQRLLVHDFIEFTRQALGLSTAPTRGY